MCYFDLVTRKGGGEMQKIETIVKVLESCELIFRLLRLEKWSLCRENTNFSFKSLHLNLYDIFCIKVK